MTEVIRVYRQSMPAMKLVGRCYGDEDRVNGTFADKWGEWFQNDLFSPLLLPGDTAEPFEDCNAYIGLCRMKEGEPFQYWIGVFMPPDAAVPDGYMSVACDAGDIAVCWVYGKEPDIYMHDCTGSLAEQGFRWAEDGNGVRYCFERYVSPRFTEPDDMGNVILDMCFYIEDERG